MPVKRGPLRPHEQVSSFSRREPSGPVPGQPEPGDSFLIVTEGAVTEKRYFEAIREKLQLSPLVVVVHPRCTDAEGLIRAAMGMYERERSGRRVAKRPIGNREPESYDHVWVIFDTDVPERLGTLKSALDLAAKEEIHLGTSTPAVELWLLLHFRDRPGPLQTAAAAVELLEEAWGSRYLKSAEAFLALWKALEPNLAVAVSRASSVRRFHEDAGTVKPCDPSTDLDLLVRALDSAAAPPFRLLGRR